MGKGLRNKRLRDFKAHVLPGLEMYYPIDRRDNGSYTITTRDHGVIDFFPKADKICFRNDNSWIIDGCNWLCNNL